MEGLLLEGNVRADTKQHLIEQQEYYYLIFFNLMDFHFVTKGCFFLKLMFVIV